VLPILTSSPFVTCLKIVASREDYVLRYAFNRLHLLVDVFDAARNYRGEPSSCNIRRFFISSYNLTVLDLELLIHCELTLLALPCGSHRMALYSKDTSYVLRYCLEDI